LEDLFRAYWPLVAGYLTRRTGSKAEGEDLAQEVFYRAAKGWLGWKGENPTAWLMAIARRTLIDAERKGRVVTTALTEELAHDSRLDAVELTDVFERLPDQQRLLLTLIHVDGFSHREVAAITGSTPAAVKTAVWRAREAFKNEWNESNE
jgi:RNA polymerase sigma-70 factor (ECF subfamily)